MKNINLDGKTVTNTCILASCAVSHCKGFVRHSWEGLCDEPKVLRVSGYEKMSAVNFPWQL